MCAKQRRPYWYLSGEHSVLILRFEWVIGYHSSSVKQTLNHAFISWFCYQRLDLQFSKAVKCSGSGEDKDVWLFHGICWVALDVDFRSILNLV